MPRDLMTHNYPSWRLIKVLVEQFNHGVTLADLTTHRCGYPQLNSFFVMHSSISILPADEATVHRHCPLCDWPPLSRRGHHCHRWVRYAWNHTQLRHVVIKEGFTCIIQAIRVELMVIPFWPMCDRYMWTLQWLVEMLKSPMQHLFPAVFGNIQRTFIILSGFIGRDYLSRIPNGSF